MLLDFGPHTCADGNVGGWQIPEPQLWGRSKTSLAISDLDTHKDLAVHISSVWANKTSLTSGACWLTFRLSAYHMPKARNMFLNHGNN